MGPVGSLARPHRNQREAGGRRDHEDQPAFGRPLQPHAGTTDPVGRRQAGHHRAGNRQDRARHGSPHCSRWLWRLQCKIVLDTDPRIVVARASGARPGNMASTVSIVPYQMMAGDEKVVASRLYALLSKPPKIAEPPAPPSGQPAALAGQWDLHLDFVHGSANHTLLLEQDGGKLVGMHQGEFANGDLSGTVAANTVRFQSSLPTEGTRVSFQFSGTAEGGKMSGTVALGEYGEARWTAEKHQYRVGGGRRG